MRKAGKENYSAIRNIDFDSNSNASTIISDTTEENFQVSGPTTRRQWSEFVSKPKSESTSAVVSSNEEDEEEKGSVVSEATTGSLSLSQVCRPLCLCSLILMAIGPVDFTLCFFLLFNSFFPVQRVRGNLFPIDISFIGFLVLSIKF